MQALKTHFRISLVLCTLLVAGVCVSIDSSAQGPQAEKVQGIEHLLELTPQLYSGARPQSKADFQQLQHLGIETVVCVDGIAPRQEQLNKYNLKLIHLPTSYSGFSNQTLRSLAYVANKETGKVFVHCHHGKHRGPAAACVLGALQKELTVAQGVQVLTRAKTNPQYHGLWSAVTSMTPEKISQLHQNAPAHLPENASVPILTAPMIDLQLGLKAIDQPKLTQDDFKAAMLLLEEGSVETTRVSQRHPYYQAKGFQQSVVQMNQLIKQLKSLPENDPQQQTELLKQLKQQCAACHAAYRGR